MLVLALTYVAMGGYLQTGVLGRPWPIRVTTAWFADGVVWPAPSSGC